MTPNIFIKNRSGIYGIRNVINNKIYVGKTTCMYRRCTQYVYDFENRKIGHLNQYLIHSIEKFGLSSFEFFPLEFCKPKSLPQLEIEWITRLNSNDRNNGYNIRLDLPSGMITSVETSQKISKNLRKQWSSGVRDSHSEKMKKSWLENPERREQQSNILRKNITKYEYRITRDNESQIVNYSGLKELGLHNVIASFHRKKTNQVEHKGYVIERFGKGEL